MRYKIALEVNLSPSIYYKMFSHSDKQCALGHHLSSGVMLRKELCSLHSSHCLIYINSLTFSLVQTSAANNII